MSASSNGLLSLVKQSINGWVEDRAASMGAALAYYTMFSIAPLLLIVVTVAGFVFGDEAARGAVFVQLAGLIGTSGAEMVEAMLKGAHDSNKALLSAVVSAVTLFIGATTVFAELQTDLDLIWKAQSRSGGGVWNFIRTRMLSFGLILGIGFLLIVSLVMSAMVSALSSLWGGWFSNTEWLLHTVNFFVWFIIITLLFAMIYKVLPGVKIAWQDVWIGAAVTSLLFAVGKFAIGLYIGKSAISSSFGAAGAFIVLVAWVYYSAQIFLLGAEFTRVYAHRRGSKSGVVSA